MKTFSRGNRGDEAHSRFARGAFSRASSRRLQLSERAAGHAAHWLGLLWLAACLVAPLSAPAQTAASKWEHDIAAFEAADKTNPPPTNAILFVGSSSIRLWKTLAQDFLGFPVINRGFGGSQMSDTLEFAGRIVLPCRPRQVLVYAGDNDLADGKSPEEVTAAFKALVGRVHATLPGTRIGYIAIKPSPSRWKLADRMKAANRLIAEFAKTDERLAFIDVFTPILGEDGQPRPDLFVADKLHLNAKGYELWAKTVRPYLR
jgi:lysophospholipase L1-like esterase